MPGGSNNTSTPLHFHVVEYFELARWVVSRVCMSVRLDKLKRHNTNARNQKATSIYIRERRVFWLLAWPIRGAVLQPPENEKIAKVTLWKINYLIMMTLGWITSRSICVYEYESSIKCTDDRCFEFYFCKSPPKTSGGGARGGLSGLPRLSSSSIGLGTSRFLLLFFFVSLTRRSRRLRLALLPPAARVWFLPAKTILDWM